MKYASCCIADNSCVNFHTFYGIHTCQTKKAFCSKGCEDPGAHSTMKQQRTNNALPFLSTHLPIIIKFDFFSLFF